MAIEDKVMQAKNDIQVLNDLLNDYKPFIQKVTYNTCQRYVEWGRDEELSIALSAFKEAVQRYQPDKGSFISLTRQIIKSRIIDYLRKESRHIHTGIDDIKENIILQDSTNPLVEEIKELQGFLIHYEISFHDLPNVSPIKKNLREELKQTAKIVAKENEIMKKILKNKQLPIKAISKVAGISHKKIERNRVYLITMVLIWHLDLPLLQGYIK